MAKSSVDRHAYVDVSKTLEKSNSSTPATHQWYPTIVYDCIIKRRKLCKNTLQETNTSHLREKENHLQNCLWFLGYVSSPEGSTKKRWFGLEEWLTSVFPIRPPLHQLWIRPATKSPHHGSTPVRRGDVCWFVLSGQKSSESNHLDKYPDKHWEFYHQLKGKEPRKKSEKKHLTNLNLRGLTNLRLYMNQCNKISHVKKTSHLLVSEKKSIPPAFSEAFHFFQLQKKTCRAVFLVSPWGAPDIQEMWWVENLKGHAHHSIPLGSCGWLHGILCGVDAVITGCLYKTLLKKLG